MPVDPFLAIAIYIIWWWLALFMVLPIGVRGVHETPDAPAGHDPGAPVAPNLAKKALWASGLALAFWALTMGFIAWDPFDVRG